MLWNRSRGNIKLRNSLILILSSDDPTMSEWTRQRQVNNLEKLFAEKGELVGPVPLESEEYTTFSDWVNMWEEVKATK
jgi:hypothetical protein